jgi:hypothetical protein
MRGTNQQTDSQDVGEYGAMSHGHLLPAPLLLEND